MSVNDIHWCENLSYIDLFRKDIKARLLTNHQYRGNVFRENVKHCFEYTITELKSKTQEIGFSNSHNRKKFVSYYANRQDKIMCKTGFLEDEIELYQCSMTLEANVAYEVCFNSEDQFFQVFKGNEYCSAHVQMDPEPRPYWYLYIDQGIGEGDLISINAGYSKFHNPIPSGYQPWIFGKPKIRSCISSYFRFVSFFVLFVPLALC